MSRRQVALHEGTLLSGSSQECPVMTLLLEPGCKEGAKTPDAENESRVMRAQCEGTYMQGRCSELVRMSSTVYDDVRRIFTVPPPVSQNTIFLS